MSLLVLAIGASLILLYQLRLDDDGKTPREKEMENMLKAYPYTHRLSHQEDVNLSRRVVNEISRRDSAISIAQRPVVSKRYEHVKLASEVTGGKPVYVSVTTIRSRIYGLASTIQSIITGSVLPDHIVIYVSEEPYLLDEGISSEDIAQEIDTLDFMVSEYSAISIVFTENIGPHRKLLPLLEEKRNEDCLIVTIDDHEVYEASMLESLLHFYALTEGESIIALRARRMALCKDHPWRCAPYTDAQGYGQWPEAPLLRHEMLMLPIGNAGVLYRPRFFDNIVFDEELRKYTETGDDLMYRLATMAHGTPVMVGCLVNKKSCQDAMNAALETKSTLRYTLPRYGAEKTAPSGGDERASKVRRGLHWVGDDYGRMSPDDEVSSQVSHSKHLSSDTWHDSSSSFHREGSSGGGDRIPASQRMLRVHNKYDPRKKVSLATKFNSGERSGNSVMWDHATSYLRKAGVFDFGNFLTFQVRVERRECFGGGGGGGGDGELPTQCADSFVLCEETRDSILSLIGLGRAR
jgi:hypothetical protein